MITVDTLNHVVTKQRLAEERRDSGLERSITVNETILTSHALVITGVRRCGKSTVMTQRIRKSDLPWLYMKFDAPQLMNFTLDDCSRLDQVISTSEPRCLYFDEIHDVLGWEFYVLEKLDEGYRVCITGSNASLLKGERAGKLTGRHISLELFPFSYREYLAYTGAVPCLESVNAYLSDGGFPRYLQTHDETHLVELFDDIIFRDVILRHGIRETASVKMLAAYLSENPGCRFTASNMLVTLGVSNASTVIQWCDWFEDAYLFFFIPKYCDSLKAQAINPRKVYCVDTGLLQIVSIRLVFNDALRFENLVFLHLRRCNREIYYFNEKKECDFIVTRRHTPIMAVQACVKLTDENIKRELDGLTEAMRRFEFSEGWIVTMNDSDELKLPEGTVHVIPFFEWAK